MDKEKWSSYDDIELGVDVDELGVLVDDGQGGDARAHEQVEDVHEARVAADGVDGCVGAEAQVADGLVHEVGLRHVVDEEVEVAEDALVRDDAHHVAGARVDDRQPVHLVRAQHAHRLEQRVLGPQPHERPAVLPEHLAPRLQLVLLQLFDLRLHNNTKTAIELTHSRSKRK